MCCTCMSLKLTLSPISYIFIHKLRNHNCSSLSLLKTENTHTPTHFCFFIIFFKIHVHSNLVSKVFEDPRVFFK
ncbi:hypothetical protein HanPSC8_Chr15g0663931 [Helianthus annuus]|nr:hypothetical protein HanPSC8_Chr15g0663931 [Helianthus annuus]